MYVKDVPEVLMHVPASKLNPALSTRFPTLIAFEIPGSRACARLADDLESLARDYVDEVRVIRVEDAREGDLRTRYSLSCVPTLVFRRHGREVARIEGAADVSAIRAHMDFLAGRAMRPPVASGPAASLDGAALSASDPEGLSVATDATFEDLVRSDRLVLVSFWSCWSCPGTEIASINRELAREYGGRLRLVEVNTDESPGATSRANVVSIPTIVLYKGGQEVGRVSALAPPSVLRRAINRVLETA